MLHAVTLYFQITRFDDTPLMTSYATLCCRFTSAATLLAMPCRRQRLPTTPHVSLWFSSFSRRLFFARLLFYFLLRAMRAQVFVNAAMPRRSAACWQRLKMLLLRSAIAAEFHAAMVAALRGAVAARYAAHSLTPGQRGLPADAHGFRRHAHERR